MPKPEEFSLIGMYGKKDIFEKRVREGYTEVAFGGGDWVGDQRIVSLWAFYHPNGRIATYEHPKSMTLDCHTVRGRPFEAEYTKRKFQKHLQKFKIRLGEGSGLAQLVENWEEEKTQAI